MAYGNEGDFDYKLIDSDTGLQDAISELKAKIADRNSLLAVDCEGNSLSRKGELTIITVATEEKVYRPISEVTSRHVISLSGGQASKQIVCVRGQS